MSNRQALQSYSLSLISGRGCGGQIYNYGGVFSSPLYPSPYRNRSVCNWDVIVPNGSKVILGFNVFDIGPKSICETDHVTVRDILPDGDEGPNSITLCGGVSLRPFFPQHELSFNKAN